MTDASHITAIKATKRDPMRVSVYVDDRFVASLPRERVADLGLSIGMAWDAAIAGPVAAAVQFDKALRDALRLLNRRAYSSGELRDRLSRKEHDSATIDHVLAYLVERKFVDDRAYGRSVIAQSLAKKPAGRRFLQNKLYQKRLPRPVADRLLDEADRGRDAVADAVELAQKRLRTVALQRCDPAARRRRLWSLLCRRGFDGETAMAALSRLNLVDED